MLTARWTKLRPHEIQNAWWNTAARFRTVPAGRRSGKTELAKRRLVKAALKGTQYPRARFFAAAPTYSQAKRIYWDDLKLLVPKEFMAGPPSESELVIRLVNGTEVHVFGMDKPERMEGSPWDGGILDEYGNMKGHVWGANIRPALSDRKGWADLIGVPEGRNHYYELDKKAKSDATGEWASYHWVSADILDPEEIAAAKRDLDELTFKQEYEASFITFEGRAYYPFDEAVHCSNKLTYDPRLNLGLCFDFNVEPGVCCIVQEQVLPGQYERDSLGLVQLNKPITGTGVIGEVYIPRSSNTPAVCRKIIEDWGKHQGRVICYGDATGGSRGSAKVEGSDWELIEKELRPTFKGQLSFKVKKANPAERARINAMNSRLKTASGVIKMLVDPAKAPNVVKDLEGVCLLKGGSGELDKASTPTLTHISDALGYYIVEEFPLVSQAMHKLQVGGV